jgi:hypothetical protein
MIAGEREIRERNRMMGRKGTVAEKMDRRE